jgi:hypothetical protein
MGKYSGVTFEIISLLSHYNLKGWKGSWGVSENQAGAKDSKKWLSKRSS